MTTPIAAIAVCKTLQDFGFLTHLRRRMNDVMINNRKICGIGSCAYEGGAVFINIGLNGNMSEILCGEVNQPVTSMFIEKGRIFDRDIVLRKLSSNLHGMVNKLVLSAGQAPST
jgi:biotin-(acetyl-CoA carboxylase) ligase